MKAILKRSAIRLMCLPPLLRAMNRVFNRNPIIFTLHRRANPEHGIGGHDPAVLRQQLEFILQNGYRAVTMDVIDAWVNGEVMDMTNTVAFTFDDGYQDQAELIQEVFLPLGVPASMFLITDFIDGRLWPWDTRIKWLIHHAAPRPLDLCIPATGLRARLERDSIARRDLAHWFISHLEYRAPEIVEAAIMDLARALEMDIPWAPPACHAPMSWDAARELEKLGTRFGSHSKSHYIFSGLSHAESEQQIRHARARLEAELDAPLTTFGYPIGNRWNFTGRELKILQASGHTSAVTMTPGIVEQVTPDRPYGRYVVNRFGMPGDTEGFLQDVSWIARIRERLGVVSPRTLIRDRYGSSRSMLKLLSTGLDYHLGRLKIIEEINWSKVQRLVFICQGNVCRSPFAEAVARQHDVPAVSFGLKTNPGTPVNPIASRIALEMGVDMTDHSSQRFEPIQLRDGDLILGMEPAHLQTLERRTNAANVQWTLLGLLLPGSKAPFLADPYGMSDAYHRRCFRLIESAVRYLTKSWSMPSLGTSSASIRRSGQRPAGVHNPGPDS